jgi:hypothetical protein
MATGERTRYDAGWGPSRDVFTTRSPAPYAVLNSTTDNPVHGDERNFVRVRLAEESNQMYDDWLLIRPGDEVVVLVAVNNDAADNLAGQASTIYGLTARAKLGSNSSTDHWLSVTLKGKNATAVWDGALLISRDPTIVELVEESAFFHSADPDGGFKVDDPVGADSVLGWTQPDGLLPVGRSDSGLELGSGYLTFRLRIEAAS